MFYRQRLTVYWTGSAWKVAAFIGAPRCLHRCEMRWEAIQIAKLHAQRLGLRLFVMREDGRVGRVHSAWVK